MLDFHAHSTVSDGLLSPAQVVRRAHERGVTRFALTDHDTVGGYAEARAAGLELGVELVPGIEISATWQGRSVHVLGYFFELEHPSLLSLLDALVHGRARRNQMIAERLLGLGIELPKDTLTSQDGGTVGRPHIARALVDRGVVKTEREAFDRYLADGRPAHVEREVVSPSRAAEVLHEAGGVAVLAHPLVLGADPSQVDGLFARAAQWGIDGAEVYYSGHSPGQVDQVGYFAKKHRLLPSGGSDFHAEPWPIHPPISLDLGLALEAKAEAHRARRTA